MRIFSGIQPTGDVHLGNYLGAIRHWVNLSKQNEDTIFCVVDMHAITVHQDPKELYESTLNLVATFLACGLDAKKSIIFAQSNVKAHAELTWILSTIARMGWLNRMTQFKDKAGKDKENASVGLFTYPILMAADILTYNATHVPVGDDQKQHLELARDIAERFNRTYGVDFFKSPEPMILGEATRVASLRDGSKKMSKSDPSDQSRILLVDTNDEIAQKIRKAKTDSGVLPSTKEELEGRFEAKNLLTIYSAIQDKNIEDVIDIWANKQFSELKEGLVEVLCEKITPIREKLSKYKNDKTELLRVLKDGADRANTVSEPILKEAQKIVGFVV